MVPNRATASWSWRMRRVLSGAAELSAEKLRVRWTVFVRTLRKPRTNSLGKFWIVAFHRSWAARCRSTSPSRGAAFGLSPEKQSEDSLAA